MNELFKPAAVVVALLLSSFPAASLAQQPAAEGASAAAAGEAVGAPSPAATPEEIANLGTITDLARTLAWLGFDHRPQGKEERAKFIEDLCRLSSNYPDVDPGTRLHAAGLAAAVGRAVGAAQSNYRAHLAGDAPPHFGAGKDAPLEEMTHRLDQWLATLVADPNAGLPKLLARGFLSKLILEMDPDHKAATEQLAVLPSEIVDDNLDWDRLLASLPMHQPVSGTLRWRNGDELPGKFLGLDAERIRWESPLFEEPVEISRNHLAGVKLSSSSADSKDPFRLKLRSGDVLYGDFRSIGDDLVRFESQRHGSITILRDRILEARRLTHESLLLAGPVGLRGWKKNSSSSIPETNWAVSPSGSLRTLAWNSTLYRSLAFPEKAEISFVVRSGARPDFRLAMGRPPRKSLSIETWEDDLVLVLKDRFVRILTLGEEDRAVSLRVLWDREIGSIAVHDDTGRRLAGFDDEGHVPPVEENKKAALGLLKMILNRRLAAKDAFAAEGESSEQGIHVENKGYDLVLDNVLVRRWDGSAPEKVERVNGERVEWLGGGAIGGQITAFKGEGTGGLEIDGKDLSGTRPGMEDVARILFSRPDAEEAAAAAEGDVDEEPTTSRVVFAWSDGELVTGELLEVRGPELMVRTSWAAEPFALEVGQALSMNWIHPEGLPVPPEPEDRLWTTAKDSFHGTIRHAEEGEAGEGRVLWKPAGARRPVALAGGGALRLSRNPSDKAIPEELKNRDRIVFSGGEIAPTSIEAISPEEIRIDSPWFENKVIPVSRLLAVEVGSGFNGLDGFSDQRWREVEGKNHGQKKAKESKVEVKGDSAVLQTGALAHPAALGGGEVEFDAEWADDHGPLAVRLFVGDADDADDGYVINLLRYSGRIWVNDDADAGNNFSGKQIQKADRKMEFRFRFKTDEAGKLSVAVLIDGKELVKFPIPATRMRGVGLVFDTDRPFFNADYRSAVTISGFRSNPGLGTRFGSVDQKSRERALTVPRFRKEDPPTHCLVAPNGDVLRGRLETYGSGKAQFFSGLEQFTFPKERLSAIVWLREAEEGEQGEEAPTDLEAAPPEEPAAEEGAAGIPGVQILGGNRVVLGNGFRAQGNLRIEVGGGLVRVNGKEVQAQEKVVEGPVAVAADAGGSSSPADGTVLVLMKGGSALRFGDYRYNGVNLSGTHPLLGRSTIPVAAIAEFRFGTPASKTLATPYDNWVLKMAPEPVIPQDGGAGGAAGSLVGEPSPAFKLDQLDGEAFSIEDQKGKVVVLDFWATWCGPCVRAMPDVLAAIEKFDKSKVAFVGVNQSEAELVISDFLTRTGWSFPVALDVEGKVAEKFQVEGIPHTVIIDAEGKVAWVHSGFKPGFGKELEERIREILGEVQTRER